MPKEISEALVSIGFPAPFEVASLHSIAHMFGSSRTRTGIYALVLPDHCVYIGQARDVVRRFAQHRLAHKQIDEFTFLATPLARLDSVERESIFRAERSRLTLTNVAYATDVKGQTDLDLVVSPEAQARWLQWPYEENQLEALSTPAISLPRPQVERFARKFQRLLNDERGSVVEELLRLYLMNVIPFPRTTEYSFWSVSCIPTTNISTWPRFCCLSAGVMELFVLGYSRHHPESQRDIWGFLNVASDLLEQHLHGQDSFKKSFPGVEIRQAAYRDGGQRQIQLSCSCGSGLTEVLHDERILRAARVLALRVMRKRATIYSRFHCKQLADRALSHSVTRVGVE